MASIFERINKHPAWSIGVVVVITALLAVPMITMAPTESASTEPSGPVFDARDQIDERFVSSVLPTFFILEAHDANMVDADSLRDLFLVGEALRSDPDVGPNLFSYFDVGSGFEVNGLVTIADITNQALGGAILTAPDAAVESAVSEIIDSSGVDAQNLYLSIEATRAQDGIWTVPAISVPVLSDNVLLGFGNQATNLGGSTAPEEYARQIQTLLREAESFDAYGVAIDVNLTSQEQGALAGPFIGFTVLAVLLIVGAVFRSYWVLATVGVALGALMVWLKGLSNLFGFDDDLVLSLIVPIAMISFGVDFAFHAVGRYREERHVGNQPRRAYVTGLTAVGAALVLALTSDAVAFLSNVTAGIESIINFGLGAAIALTAAFVLLGVVTPLVVALIEERVGEPPVSRRSQAIRVAGSLGAASMVMGSVLLMVFVLPWAGVVLYVVTVLATLVIPMQIRSRRRRDRITEAEPSIDRLAPAIGRVVAALAARPLVVLPVALLVTAVAATFAVQVPTEFDVEDFFSSDSDFVVSLDLLDQHVGDRGGEPAQFYIEGDLTDPAVVSEIGFAVEAVKASDSSVLGRDSQGVLIGGGLTRVIESVWEHPASQGLIARETGVTLTDDDGDGVPDTREQLEALYSVTAEFGVPFDETRLAMTPDDVAVSIDFDGDESATVFSVGLVNSRSRASIVEAEQVLTVIADELRSEIGGTVQLTGSPFVRQSSLDATSRALSVSLPIAVVLCLVVASVFLKSVRFGFASVLPILMTVAWLYGFMEVAGYSINIVTATIAAVSIGIGIDFAIHFIARYREELARLGDRHSAVRAAGEGTGTALVASALSSAVGFGILAFAPMPLFAAYGFLTAVMIGMASIATLVVLPGILVLITGRSSQTAASDETAVRTAV